MVQELYDLDTVSDVHSSTQPVAADEDKQAHALPYLVGVLQ